MAVGSGGMDELEMVRLLRSPGVTFPDGGIVDSGSPRHSLLSN